jgi:hypothetical protein
MILKQSRDNKTVATYETEEAAVKANHLSLALLRSHLNSKKPKYLDGFVYVVASGQPAPNDGGVERMEPEKEAQIRAAGEKALSGMTDLPPGVTFVEHKDFHMDTVTLPLQEVSANLGSASTVPPVTNLAPTSEYKINFPEPGPEFRKSMQDIIDMNIAITHTDTEGNQRRVDPTSEEGEEVLRRAANTPPEGDWVALSEDDFEPSLPGEEQGFDLRKIAKQQLSPDDADLPPIETDFSLTPMQKRAKELKKRPPL